MTIPEAARLVLQAAAIGETGQVLVLDMGEPVKIVDLARTMIRLSGHSEQEIRIEFTGLRPGEKLFEELLADADATLPTRFAQLRIARLADQDRSGGVVAWLHHTSAEIEHNPSAALLKTWIQQVVPEYRAA